MSGTLEHIWALGKRLNIQISVHGYEELAADKIRVRDIVKGLTKAVLIEDYPDYPKGPCCLVLQRDGAGQPIHVVWGIPAGQDSPAVLVTAYQPDPTRWDGDVAKETDMTAKLTRRLIREGDFVAEVDVHLVEEEGGWSPYLSLEDAGKLDAVREALRAGDITRGAKLATHLYRLTPVEA